MLEVLFLEDVFFFFSHSARHHDSWCHLLVDEAQSWHAPQESIPRGERHDGGHHSFLFPQSGLDMLWWNKNVLISFLSGSAAERGALCVTPGLNSAKAVVVFFLQYQTIVVFFFSCLHFSMAVYHLPQK